MRRGHSRQLPAPTLRLTATLLLLFGGLCSQGCASSSLRSAELPNGLVVRGSRYPPGTIVHFFSDSNSLDDKAVFALESVDLPRDTAIQGVTYKGGRFPLDPEIAARLEKLVGTPNYYEVSFHSDGRVRAGTLAFETRLGEVRYKAGTNVEFHPDGHVKKGILATETVIDGVTLPAGTEIEYSADGKLERAGGNSVSRP